MKKQRDCSTVVPNTEIKGLPGETKHSTWLHMGLLQKWQPTCIPVDKPLESWGRPLSRLCLPSTLSYTSGLRAVRASKVLTILSSWKGTLPLIPKAAPARLHLPLGSESPGSYRLRLTATLSSSRHSGLNLSLLSLKLLISITMLTCLCLFKSCLSPCLSLPSPPRPLLLPVYF